MKLKNLENITLADIENPALYLAAKYSERNGYPELNFHESIQPGSIYYDSLVVELKDLGIERFTISDRSSGLMEFMKYFTENGYHLLGMTTIKTPSRFEDEVYYNEPAVVFGISGRRVE